MSQSLTIQTVEAEFEHIVPQIAAMLPPDVSPDKFRQVALAAIRKNPDLLKCNQQSLFNACLNAAQDGLMPDGREGAIVPRKGSAVWQPMIGGIFKRVKSSGSVTSLVANVVYAGEEFAVLLGDEDRIVHRRDLALVQRGSEVAVYAIAKLKDGSAEREVMTWEQVQKVRQASAMPNSGPWTEWGDEMARKTVVRRLAKRLPVLEQGDEVLQRTIGRVDQLYDFGSQRAEAPSPPPLKAVAASTPRPPRVVGEPVTTPREERKAAPKTQVFEGKHPLDVFYGHQWMLNLETLLANAQTRDEVVDIGGHESVGYLIAQPDTPADVKQRISELLANGYKRFVEPTDTPDDLAIEGEKYLAAG